MRTLLPMLALSVTVAAQAPKTNLGSDANGNPLRLAVKTGHVSNYDEIKVAPYTLPDPLVMADGTPVARRPRLAVAAAAGDPRAVRERDLRPHPRRTRRRWTWRVTETDRRRARGRRR